MIRKVGLIYFIVFLVSDSAFSQSSTDSLATNIDSLTNQFSAYQTLSARAKIVWDDGDKKQNFQATIRIRKDSLIWMSLSSGGIEGARLLITPDSVLLLNRLADEYNQTGFDLLQQWFLFPVNFKMLQELIAGEKISIEEKASHSNNEDSMLVVYAESEKLFEKIWVDTAHYTPQKILLKDKLFKQDMTITFDGYNYFEQKPFAYKRNISVSRHLMVLNLEMEFTKVIFDAELSFPFEVNKKYKRTE